MKDAGHEEKGARHKVKGKGSPYKAMQVREYRLVLLCKYLIFRYGCQKPEYVTC